MKLQFTNGYRPHFDQISRIMQYILLNEAKTSNRKPDIVAATGIPNKQVENLTSMMTGFGLVFPRTTTLTLLGKTIVQHDPYFDKIESLWIMHYIVSSDPKWVVWYRIVNSILPLQDSFDVEKVSRYYFTDLSVDYSEQAVSRKLPKEVGAVFAAYTRSNFSHLRILQEEGQGNFVRTNPVDIPDLAFLYCLLHYRDEHKLGSSAINTEDASLAEYSPGRVFNIPEYQVRTNLGNLHNAELVRLEQLANLDQVRLPQSLTKAVVLARIYREKNAN